MPFLRCIGDSHNLHNQYLDLTKDCEYTIQVGDVGYEYRILREKLRPGRDFAVFGNHEQYDKDNPEYCMNQPFALKDYGVLELPNFEPIFYVRGAWSIDWKIRLSREWCGEPKSWFENEELSEAQLNEAIYLYKYFKPNFVISHEAPYEVVQYVTNPRFPMNFGYEPGSIRTRTSMALQTMFEAHSPEVWAHGHYHFFKDHIVNGTRFISLDMLGRTPDNKFAYIDFPAKVSL